MMKSTITPFQPTKLVYQPEKPALQIAISVANGYAYFVDSNNLPIIRIAL